MTRHVSVALVFAFLLLLVGCASAPRSATDALVETIDAALGKAGRYLIDRQSRDGAWRSRHYGVLKDGPTMTPHVLSALFHLPQAGAAGERSFRGGVGYLMRLVGADGRIDADRLSLGFPVYTAAAASWVVVLREQSDEHKRAAASWLNVVRDHQLDEDLGWWPGEASYGGWSYAIVPPRRPEAGHGGATINDSNISATLFAIGALRAAGATRGDPALRRAAVFVQRCQNFADHPDTADAPFDDGGFFFSPTDPTRNKPGSAGADRSGRIRYHSYGSATADGLRALIRCGLPLDHRRVRAAHRWLANHFSAGTNPGRFEPDREVLRDSYYHYYCWSVAHAFMAVGVRRVRTADGEADWPAQLARELIARQRRDGSWTNRFTDAKEDDPLVSTPLAAAALSICRMMITGESRALASPANRSTGP